MINIIIKNVYNEKFEIYISENSSILELTQYISYTLNIPKKSFRLLYNGYSINDDNTVIGYNIKDGSIIHILRVIY
jgi:organic radical activating enzyme